MITPNAKRIVAIIAEEAEFQRERIKGGWLRPDQFHACLYESLAGKARRDADLRAFLERPAEVPAEEDEDPSVPWAEDPRPMRDNDVRHTTSTPNRGHGGGGNDMEVDPPWPIPGQRIA